MNRAFWRLNRRWTACLGLGLAGLLVAGCGPEAPSTSSTAEPGAEVRGEPIRGEPIVQAPAAAPATASATAPEVANAPGSTSDSAGTTVAKAGGAAEPAVTAAPVAAGAESGSSPAVANPGTGDAKATAVAEGAGTAADPMAVTFDKLASFSYAIPEGPVDTNTVAQAEAPQQIPAGIRALNERFISLKGFMLPLKVEKGLVTELLIMRDQSMCCYGTVPKINEWVSVKMVGEGVKPVMDQAVTLFGKLKVGEMYENGYLVGIYALDGERMAGPLDL